ncbi:imidazole glycerol phosphate synthase subunit HisH [Solibacillus sp. R5-41]|uniref:imidazole glycerol phosphate synthase subunit HisH n=1 Tax=Solibacillus sp. R5-41 TaxID=2048654 RepID=UPI000C128815|nr:imidazole glycerol phosphate synthase subunit HisH [Solibacillus sp. R5-41]ATP41738.1 imidazole glycerol phosphate synthase subunit HisH [Solibacillus sp. R5-41]
MKIGVIDYGMGNLFSVEQALKRLNAEVIVTSDKAQLNQADALVLPGVGAFPDAMKRLQETDLIDYIKATKKPFLGICLGMQLLFEASDEVTPTIGLGIFKGRIERFKGVSRIPHMGWNDLTLQQTPNWLQNKSLPKDRFVYFVHSFYASNIALEQLVAAAHYEGVTVPGIVARDNFTGMQFHPEKSGQLGIFLLREWANGVEATVC